VIVDVLSKTRTSFKYYGAELKNLKQNVRVGKVE
jgi:hypothetical protein